MEQTEQQAERAVREAIFYRYKAIALNPYERDFTTETVLSECWEFLTVSNGYWIFRAENKGLAIPANIESLTDINKIESLTDINKYDKK